VNPYFIYDSGMQLSFLAVYSLAVIFPWCDDRLKRFCDKRKNERLYKVGSLLLPGIVLQAAMMPLTAFHFLNFAPLAVFVNPIAIYIASLLLPAGLLCFLVHPFKLLLSAAAGVSYAISHALKLVSALADRLLPGFSVPAPPLSMLLLYYALLFYFFSEMRHIMIRRGRSNTVAAGFVVLAFSCCILPVVYGKSMSPFPWKYNEYKAVFVDIGQGDCTHIRSQGVNILMDGGGSYYKDVAGDTLKPYLLKNGVTHIDLAMVTHLDTDHSKGIADLSQQMRIDTIAFPESVRGSDISSFNAGEIIYLKEGDVINAGGAGFTVLSAGFSGADPNEGSLVTLCSIGDLDILFTGDAPVSVENRIVRDGFHDMHIEVLKAGHHGSSTSTGSMLLASNSFDMAVISCGKNNRYGHPSAETLSRLDASGIRIRRTDLEGAICIR
jgi:competence protein ComEC